MSDARGIKHDTGKPRPELLPADALLQIAQVFTIGAQKYDDRNWELGIKYSRLFGALQRHLLAYWDGEDLDPETGLPHLAHAGCNMLMLLESQRFDGLDDRPKHE